MILAGDILPEEGIWDFITNRLNPWLAKAPVKRTVLTWGNHDWPMPDLTMGVKSANVLVEQVIKIGGIKIYGSPWSLPYMRWAWMAPERTLAKIYQDIPKDVDVIVSHAPPYGWGDMNSKGEHWGSRRLRFRMEALPNLKLLVCGHIHEGYGRYGIVANVSSVYNAEGRYIPRIDPWTVVDI